MNRWDDGVEIIFILLILCAAVMAILIIFGRFV
jgi:hypothetical protein